MAWLGTLISGGVQMYGQNDANRANEAAGNFQAAQLRQNAGQAQAVAQRRAEEVLRQSRLLASRAQALAGGGGSDESVVKTISDIAAEGELRALSELYEGDVTAQDMRERAKARVFDTTTARKAGNLAMAGTIFNTGSQLYSKYGGGGSSKYEIDHSRAGGEVGDYAMPS